MSLPFYRSAVRFLSSLKLAVLSLTSLAAVLAWATAVEASEGSAFARWYVYDRSWFHCLLGLLGANIFFAAAVRFPWNRKQGGFVITHLGLLVLLGGSIWSFARGVEGTVRLGEGETVDEMVLEERCQVAAAWMNRPSESRFVFAFDPGPADWISPTPLNIGAVDGVRVQVLEFLRHAEPVSEWVRDDSRMGGPAIKLKITGGDGAKVGEEWLADQTFGEALFVGSIRIQLERAATDAMLADFLQPPGNNLGTCGLLAIYFQDAAEHVLVDDQMGRLIQLGNTGASVEIVGYLPHAVPDRMGTFLSQDDEPKNPMVELLVRLPGGQPPLRQIAFAKDPLLNLDGVYARDCPVKFRFHHAVVPAAPAFEMLQTSDGKLHGRLNTDGRRVSGSVLRVGDSLDLPGNLTALIAEHLPHARRVVRFRAIDRGTGDEERRRKPPAARVEITAGGASQQLWLQRSDQGYGQRTIVTPEGSMEVRFEPASAPLGFALTLIDFRRERNPGDVGDAAYTSQVRVVDSSRGVDEQREIAMNQPLTYGQFTLYQSGFDNAADGGEISSLRVASDPGRVLKYAGGLMICLGIAMMFATRAYSLDRVAKSDSGRARESLRGA